MLFWRMQCETIKREMLAISVRGEMTAAVAQVTVWKEIALALLHHA